MTCIVCAFSKVSFAQFRCVFLLISHYNYDKLKLWKVRAYERRPAPTFGGLPLQHLVIPMTERRAITMYITYSDLIQSGIFIVALVGLCYTIFTRSHYCNRGGWSHKRLTVSFRQAVCLWLSYFYYSISFFCIQDVLLCLIFEILNFAIFISPFYLNQQVASHLIHDSETIRRSG